MYKLLSIYIFFTGGIAWGSILATHFFIDFNRNYASSSYPGDLTVGQEWMYLIIATLIFCIVQFIAMNLVKRQLKDKRGYRALYFILILAVIIFFCMVYSYLFKL